MVADPSRRRRAAGTGPRQQGGVTLIEVLVALLIFSFGVLGMVALQARATQYSFDAEDRSRAALLANEIATQMWMAQSTTLGSDVVSAWQTRVQTPTASGLPNATGTVGDPDSEGVVTIEIKWRSPSKASTDADSSYITKVVLP